jgi:hypothetical protein
MSRRAQRIALAALLILTPCAAQAQVIWQPTPAPLVTAENSRWFSLGEPVEWNGDLYYPGGAAQHFNPYQMVRAGSFRGIPLYTDTMLQPNSVVFVPLSGGRMQPYERPRSGDLAGTVGSREPSFPADAVPSPASDTLRQAPSAPAQAPAYDASVAPFYAAPDSLRAISQPMAAAGTTGRVVPRTVATLVPPTGVNGIWVNYDGRRWFSAGKAIDYDPAALTEVGRYQGWSVYMRHGDRSTIYIPAAPGRLAGYTVRREN